MLTQVETQPKSGEMRQYRITYIHIGFWQSAFRQWIYVPTLANAHVHYEVAFPISFKREKFVVVGTSEGADTIVGIIQDSLSIFKIATSNRVPAYVIAIGV